MRINGWIGTLTAACLVITVPAFGADEGIPLERTNDPVLKPAEKQDKPDTKPQEAQPLTPQEQARIQSSWNRYWREFAPSYYKHGDRYIYVSGYKTSLPSSVGLTLSAYKQKSAWTQKYADGYGKPQSRKLTKPDGEYLAAAAALPKVEVGKYGYINSGHIMEIVDGKTLVLENIWLIATEKVREQKDAFRIKALEGLNKERDRVINDRRDRVKYARSLADRRESEIEAIDWYFKEREDLARRQRDRDYLSKKWTIIGYRTDKLAEDKRWPVGKAADKGLQLLIVEVTSREVTAVPAAVIGRGLSEQAFLGMLIARGISQAQFVEMVTEARRESREDYAKTVFAQLQGDVKKPDNKQAGGDEGDKAEDPGGNDTVELAD